MLLLNNQTREIFVDKTITLITFLVPNIQIGSINNPKEIYFSANQLYIGENLIYK